MEKENVQIPPLHKRTAIRRVFGVAAFASALSIVSEAALSMHDSKRLPYKEDLDPIGNLTVRAFAINHREQEWQSYSADTRETVKPYKLVIPEYFPPEYQELAQNSNLVVQAILKLNEKSNFFFHKLSDELLLKRKEVWVLDPAYCQEFAYVRALANTSESTGLMGFVALRQDSKVETSRRDFLKFATKAGFSSLFAASSLASKGGLVGAGVQEDFRRVCIAEGFHQMSAYFKSPESALTIYPPSHWEKIKHYILNPDERKKRLKMYSVLREIPGMDNLFMMRHYSAIQTDAGVGWKLSDKIPLIAARN